MQSGKLPTFPAISCLCLQNQHGRYSSNQKKTASTSILVQYHNAERNERKVQPRKNRNSGNNVVKILFSAGRNSQQLIQFIHSHQHNHHHHHRHRHVVMIPSSALATICTCVRRLIHREPPTSSSVLNQTNGRIKTII